VLSGPSHLKIVREIKRDSITNPQPEMQEICDGSDSQTA
jgi:hypothetical protein